MQSKDIAVGLGAFYLNGKSWVLGASEGAIEPANQRVKLCRGEALEGDVPMFVETRLSGVSWV